MRLVVVCFILFILPFHTFADVVYERLLATQIDEDECALGNSPAELDKLHIHSDLDNDTKAVIKLVKANYYLHCLMDKEQHLSTLKAMYTQSFSTLNNELKGHVLRGLSNYSFDSALSYHQGCEYLRESIFPTKNISKYLQYERDSSWFTYCDNKSVIKSYRKLIELYKEFEILEDKYYEQKALNGLYFFLKDHGAITLSQRVLNTIIDEYETTLSKEGVAFNFFAATVDNFKLGRYEQAMKRLNDFKSHIDEYKLDEFYYLHDLLSLLHSFYIQDYIKTMHFFSRLSPKLAFLFDYLQSGKLYIFQAYTCVQMNDTRCVDSFVNNQENRVTGDDKADPYLASLILTIHAYHQGNIHFANHLKHYSDFWQQREHHLLNAELSTVVFDMANASIGNQYKARLLKASNEPNLTWYLGFVLAMFILIYAVYYLYTLSGSFKASLRKDPVVNAMAYASGLFYLSRQKLPSNGNTNRLHLLTINGFLPFLHVYGYKQSDRFELELVDLLKRQIAKKTKIVRLSEGQYLIVECNIDDEKEINIMEQAQTHMNIFVNQKAEFFNLHFSTTVSTTTCEDLSKDLDKAFIRLKESRRD